MGRWKFALNASLRETKNYVDIKSAEEMKAIWERLGLKSSHIKIWPSQDGKVVRVYGVSPEEVDKLTIQEALKVYKAALENGEIEEDESFDTYSMPAIMKMESSRIIKPMLVRAPRLWNGFIRINPLN